MRILWVTQVFGGLRPLLVEGRDEPTGMPAAYVVMKGLAAAGHEVHVLTNLPSGKQGWVCQGICVYHIGAPAWTRRVPIRHGRFIANVIMGIVKGFALVNSLRPDIVYGHEGHGASVGYALARLGRVPNVTRIYGSTLVRRYGVNPRQWWLRSWPHVLPFVVPAAHIICTDDGGEADKVAGALGVPPRRFHYWLNGVDKQRFRPAASRAGAKRMLGLAEDEFLIVNVTGGAGWKAPGLERTIRCLAPMLRSRPDTRLIIVGGDRGRSQRAQLIEELGVADRVTQFDTVPANRVPDFLCATDVYVSLYDGSNLSNTVLEALASGCCVVALDVGDTWKVIRDGETGILVRPEALNGLANLVSALLDDEPRRTVLGRGARRLIEEDILSWDERVRREIELLVTVATR